MCALFRRTGASDGSWPRHERPTGPLCGRSGRSPRPRPRLLGDKQSHRGQLPRPRRSSSVSACWIRPRQPRAAFGFRPGPRAIEGCSNSIAIFRRSPTPSSVRPRGPCSSSSESCHPKRPASPPAATLPRYVAPPRRTQTEAATHSRTNLSALPHQRSAFYRVEVPVRVMSASSCSERCGVRSGSRRLRRDCRSRRPTPS